MRVFDVFSVIWDFTKAIASVGILATATVGLFQLFSIRRSLRFAEKNLRFTVYRDIMKLLEDRRPARQLLEKRTPLVDNAAFEALAVEEQKELDDLAREYDKLGLMVKHGVVPLDFVMDFYSRPLVLAWEGLKWHICAERERRKQPRHMVKFEKLAELAADYRHNVLPAFEPSGLKDAWR